MVLETIIQIFLIVFVLFGIFIRKDSSLISEIVRVKSCEFKASIRKDSTKPFWKYKLKDNNIPIVIEFVNGISITPKDNSNKELQFFYNKVGIIGRISYNKINFKIKDKIIFSKKEIKKISIGRKNINLNKYVIRT